MLSAALRYAVLAAGLPAVLSASSAFGDETASFVVSDWQAPTGIATPCRDAAHFAALTRERVGSSGARQDTLEVQIRIDRVEDGLRLQMTTRAGADSEDASAAAPGERELFAPSCETLLQTAAVVLSLALLPDYFQNERDHTVVTVRSASAASGSRTGQEQARDSEVPIIPESDIQHRADRGLGNEPLDVGVNMAVLADVGTLPQPAVGLALVFHAEAASYQLAFRLSRWAEQQAFVEAREPGKGARFDYLAGNLQLCKTVWKGSGFCGLATAGRLSAEAISISEPLGQAKLMLSAGGAVFVESRAVSWARFRVQAEVGTHLLLPRYTVLVRPPDNSLELVEREIHQPSVVYGLLSASWGLAF